MNTPHCPVSSLSSQMRPPHRRSVASTRFVPLLLALAFISASLLASACVAQDQAPPPPNKAQQAQLKRALKKGAPHLKKVARQILSPLEFQVAFKSGTERAFANRYWDHKRSGIYVDLISGRPLFSSAHKFKSGSGWPSFDRALDEVEVVEVVDKSHGMTRVEVRSKMSDIHLGHVFEDGPRRTTGRRFCINSASIRFVPKERMEAEGYGEWIKKAGL